MKYLCSLLVGRSEACRYLLDNGAPAGIYDDCGNSALSLMVEKMPDVAKEALGQFQQVDKALRRKYYYINYLEVETWKTLGSRAGTPLRQSWAKSSLEVRCDNSYSYSLILGQIG